MKIFENEEREEKNWNKRGGGGRRELDRLSTSPLLHAAKIFPFREIK